MAPAEVDVIVPVHTTARPIARAVDSVLRGTRARVRVIVVCHEVDPAHIRRAVGGDPRIELIPYGDGRRSPAGPLSRGLDAVDAGFFAKLDSDDTLQPGALDAWLEIARGQDAAIVMPRMAWPGAVPTPPLRPRRRAIVDPVADRLAYRTSTMGLVSRDLVARARPVEGLLTGEDIAPSLRLWFSGARIAWAGRAPAYLVGVDGDERATAGRSLGETLAFVPSVTGDGELRALPARDRAAIAAKLMRVHVFGAIAAHAGAWTADDRATLARAVDAVCAFGDAEGAFSIADRRLLRGAQDPASPADELDRRARARRRRGHPSTLLPAHARGWTRPDGAGRIDAAFALTLLRTPTSPLVE
ncbi:glycosyltransferase family 2 protein [Microbacterium sp. No. 7]|uniref:glycosyltransferase family 2 protein n=1 Tax=Microbacterium sp. No. 7 TaxID=1714373 RepID=UPI0006D1199F|nr:glycosyltransferase family A protein [Microbacterium sp. No. 7]